MSTENYSHLRKAGKQTCIQSPITRHVVCDSLVIPDRRTKKPCKKLIKKSILHVHMSRRRLTQYQIKGFYNPVQEKKKCFPAELPIKIMLNWLSNKGCTRGSRVVWELTSPHGLATYFAVAKVRILWFRRRASCIIFLLLLARWMFLSAWENLLRLLLTQME